MQTAEVFSGPFGPLVPLEKRANITYEDLLFVMNRSKTLFQSKKELLEALELAVDALNEPGIADIDQWKRDCKLATAKARAAIAKAQPDPVFLRKQAD